MADSLLEAFVAVGIKAPLPSRAEPDTALDPESEPGLDPVTGYVTQPLDRDLSSVLDHDLATGSVIAFAGHTVARYCARFEPECDFTEGKRRLYARLYRGVYSPERPGWLVHVPKVKDPRQRHNVGYLVVDDEIVLPLRDSMAGASRSVSAAAANGRDMPLSGMSGKII